MHLLEAGQTEQGVDYLLLAGDQARSQYAHQEAIDNYLQALDFAKETEDNARSARILMKLGLTYHNAFQYRESRQAYEEGFIYMQRYPEGSDSHEKSPAPHPLRVPSLPPLTFDPGTVFDTTSATFIAELFSGLVQLTPELSIVPDVARSWDVLQGGREYRFHLRDDVAWSDGHPLTASDFEFAWKRVLDPALNSRSRNLFFDIAGVRDYVDGNGSLAGVGVSAESETEFIVRLDHPTGYFLQLLASANFLPVPKHIVEADGESWTHPDNIASNGAFRLISMEPAKRIVLKRYANYHGSADGNLEEVEVSIYDEHGEDPLRWYEEDDLDQLLFYWLSPVESDRARHQHADDYINLPALAGLYLGFDCSRPPFDDPRVRRAFSQAIDRDELTAIAFRGQHAPATGSFVPPGMPGHIPEVALPFDVDLARNQLEAAGYPDGAGFPVIECVGAKLPSQQVLMDHVQSQWKEHLGIEIAWEQMEFGRFLERLRSQMPHVTTQAWAADYPDPDNFLRIAALETINTWRNPRFDELVKSAGRSVDQEERMRMYAEAQRLLIEEAPIFPLTYNRGHGLLKPWISQFPMSSMRWSFWKDVVIEPHD